MMMMRWCPGQTYPWERSIYVIVCTLRACPGHRGWGPEDHTCKKWPVCSANESLPLGSCFSPNQVRHSSMVISTSTKGCTGMPPSFQFTWKDNSPVLFNCDFSSGQKCPLKDRPIGKPGPYLERVSIWRDGSWLRFLWCQWSSREFLNIVPIYFN